MIDYPIEFAEEQTRIPHINYYYLVTGQSRIKIDAIKGNVDNAGLPYGDIICPPTPLSINYATTGDTIPFGSVPIPSGTLSLILVTDYYRNYDWASATISVYATHEYFPDGEIFITAFRVTNVNIVENRINLTLDNRFQTRSLLKNLVDDKMPDATYSPAINLITEFGNISNALSPSFRQDTTSIYDTFPIANVKSSTYRQMLSDLASIGGGGMILHTENRIAYSGFKFAPLDFRKYEPTDDTGIENNKEINQAGNIIAKDGCSVTGYIPIDFTKPHIFKVGSYTEKLRFSLYGQDNVRLATDPISDFETAAGQGYIYFPRYYDLPSDTGYIRLTVPTENLPDVYFRAVDHVLSNWLDLDVGLPVRATGIKYTFAGNEIPLLSNSAILTQIDTTGDTHAYQNHLTLVLNGTAYAGRTEKYRDYYVVFNKTTGEVIETGYDGTNVTWNNANYVLLSHGNYSKWMRYFIHVGDNLSYDNNNVLKVNANSTEQKYIIDLTDNQTLANSSVTYVTEAISRIAENVLNNSFYPFSGEYIDFPFVEPFDTVCVIDRSGNVYFSFVTEFRNTNYGKSQISNNVKYGTMD